MRVLVKKIRTPPLPRLLSAEAPSLAFLVVTLAPPVVSMPKVTSGLQVVLEMAVEVSSKVVFMVVFIVVLVFTVVMVVLIVVTGLVVGLVVLCKIPLCICKRSGASSGGF